ncbi:MAG TPA: DUF2059 domain-containing protein [Sphingomonadaceae bacterium]|nr:DUF2059 domain-containing protein [Sphingomonadaceae bacterium]
MKSKALVFAAAFALGSSPAAAQDLSDIFGDGPNPITIMKDVLKADPLTAEEEARLPAARQVADSLMPPGAYGKAMQESFGPLADRIMAVMEPGPAERVADLTGLLETDLENVSEGNLEAVATMLDPDEKERNSKMVEFAFLEISALLDRIEPFYRDGLARAYAKRFDAAELAQINAFFATPAGSKYAGSMMAVMMDPQVMAKIPDMIPAAVGQVAEAGTRFVMNLDTIPQARKVDDLSPAERARMLSLLGMNEDEYAELTAAALEAEWEDSEEVEEDWDPGLTETPLEGGLEEVE